MKSGVQRWTAICDATDTVIHVNVHADFVEAASAPDKEGEGLNPRVRLAGALPLWRQLFHAIIGLL